MWSNKDGGEMIWLTDPHFDNRNEQTIQNFHEKLQKQKVDGIFVTGDIAEHGACMDCLEAISNHTSCPVFFVLGNHDFHGSKIGTFQKDIKEHFSTNSNIHYLPSMPFMQLTPNTAIIGIDNWYDLRAGDYLNSDIVLADFNAVEDFCDLSRKQLQTFLNTLSIEIVAQLEKKLSETFAQFKHVVLLAHVPPFREACLYNGQASGDTWVPFFIHDRLGKFLYSYMKKFLDHSLTVLSGHTHCEAQYDPLPNLHVRVGAFSEQEINWEKLHIQ